MIDRRPSACSAPAVLLLLLIALRAGGAAPAAAERPMVADRPVAPTQTCEAEVSRRYDLNPSRPLLWGDELNITVEIRLTCSISAPTRLSVTETLPPGLALVGGIGRPPDATQGQAQTWHFDHPVLAPDVLRLGYRVYATPDPGAFDAEGRQALAWPMILEIGQGAGAQRLPPPVLEGFAVHERAAGLGCGMARSRSISPERVLAGQPFTVSLRLAMNVCAPFARRTRGMIAMQPWPDAAEMLRQAQVVTALLDPARVQAENAMFGALMNDRGAPRIQPPTTELIFVEDLARNHPPSPDGGGDAATALSAALDQVPDWPAHHEVVFYITHAGAAPSDPAALAAVVERAGRQGVELVPICVGGSCEPGLTYAYSPADLRYLRRDLLQGLAEQHRGPALEVEAIEVSEHLHRFVQAEPNSAQPPARLDGDRLRWRLAAPAPGQALELHYRARVDIWGRLPLGTGSRALAVYREAGRQAFELPRGTVIVDRDPNAGPKPCRPALAKSAAPPRLPLGESVEIRLDFGAECPDALNLVDAVMVLDVSGSMSGKIEDARTAAQTFVDLVLPGPAQLGLVTFDHQVQTVVPLSADFDPLRLALVQMQAGGGTQIDLGLERATELLLARRAGASPVIILMTDGYSGGGPEPVLEAALKAKAQGILVVTICFGAQCDPSLEEAATLPRFFFQAADADALLGLFVEMGLLLRQLGLTTAEVADELPANMRYLPGSAQPPPAELRPAAGGRGETLVWRFERPPLGGVGIRYRAEPLILGEQPTNTRAELSFVDDEGRSGGGLFPVPRVEAYIPDPKGPCHPALVKTAAPERVVLGEPVAVALGIRMDCPKVVAPLDIVLVIDHSASMGALDRLPNAQLAANAFLDQVDPADTRVGLVSFGDAVTGRVPLAADYAPLRRAIAALRPNGQTALSQALNAARELLARRRPEAIGAVVLLTDGRNTAGVDPMLAAADRLKADGTHLVTVCAGDCDAALVAVASRPTFAYQVSDSTLLVDLFRRLAQELTTDRLHDLVVTDAFPSAVTVDPASFSPAPELWTGAEARWRFPTLPEAGLVLGYSLRPQVAGRVPANRFARLDYRFGLGQTGQAYFPVPVIEAIGPDPTATATAVPSAGTPTPGTSTTPGPIPGTPSAPTAHWRCYLPRLDLP